MKLACVQAIADLARAEPSDLLANAYGSADLAFGPTTSSPKPFDPRLIIKIAPARRARGHGVRRGHAPDRGLRRLHPRADQFRLSLGHDHAAGVRDRA